METYEIQTINQIKQANMAAGHFWFEPSNMRYFNTRLSSTVYPAPGCTYFVSSERYDSFRPRGYTIRVAYPSGTVSTIGAFQSYATAKEAHEAARAFRESGEHLAGPFE